MKKPYEYIVRTKYPDEDFIWEHTIESRLTMMDTTQLLEKVTDHVSVDAFTVKQDDEVVDEVDLGTPGTVVDIEIYQD